MTCSGRWQYCHWGRAGFPARAGVSPELLGRGSGLWGASVAGRGVLLPQPHSNLGTQLALIELHHTLHFQFPTWGALEPSEALRMMCAGSASSCMAKPSPCSPLPCVKADPSHGYPIPLSLLVSFLGLQHCPAPRTCPAVTPHPLQPLSEVHQPPNRSPNSPTAASTPPIPWPSHIIPPIPTPGPQY